MIEFNEVKDELQNLRQLMGMMMRKLDSQVPASVTRDLGSPPIIQSQEVLTSQNQHMPTPSTQINVPQPMAQYEH